MKRLLLRDRRRGSQRLSCIILFAVLLGGVMPAMAQRPVGDTVVGREPSYLYSNWPSDSIVPLMVSRDAIYTKIVSDARFHAYGSTMYKFWAARDDFDISGNHIAGREIVVAEPVSVIGVAACAYADSSATILTRIEYDENGGLGYSGSYIPGELHNAFPDIRDVIDTTMSGRATEYLQLYGILKDTPVLVEQGAWRHEHPHRRMQYMTGVGNNVLHLQEVLFDTSIVLDTNFIVAGTSNNNTRTIGSTMGEQGLLVHACCYYQWDHFPTRYSNLCYVRETYPSLYSRPEDVFWCKVIGDTADWRFTVQPDSSYYCEVPLLFPILDTNYTPPCTAVERLRRVSYTDSTVTVVWNAGARQTQWEVAYGFDTALYDNYQVVTTTAPTATLRNMIAGARYCVRVRGLCGDTTSMGPWSNTICFNAPVPDTTSGGGGGEGGEGGDTTAIAQPTNLDLFTSVMPNPATGQVVVTSSYGLYHVYAYDLQGRTMLDMEVRDLMATFDVSDWPKGVYVVALRTPQGLATKCLVVR